MTRSISVAFAVSFMFFIVGLSQLAAANSSVPKEKPSALTGELGVLNRPDGGVSDELSLTVNDPRLNNGRATNIPLLVKGQVDVKKLLQHHPSPSQRQIEIAISRR